VMDGRRAGGNGNCADWVGGEESGWEMVQGDERLSKGAAPVGDGGSRS